MARRGARAGIIAALAFGAGEGLADETPPPSPEPKTPAATFQPAPPSTSATSQPAPVTAGAPEASAPPPSSEATPKAPAPDRPPQVVAPSVNAAPVQQLAPPAAQPPVADPSAPYSGPPVQLVPIDLYGTYPGARYTLDPVVLWPGALQGQCVGDCSLQLHPGSYRLTVEGNDLVTGSREIDIPGPSRLEVEPRTQGQRSTGLVLGIVGSALVLAGYVMIIVGANQEQNSDEHGLVLTGVLSLVGGAVMTPIGWVKFGRKAPRVSVEPLSSPRTFER